MPPKEEVQQHQIEYKIFKELVSHAEVDLNIMDRNDKTPLIVALQTKNYHQAMVLIQRGASVTFFDKIYAIPLNLVAKNYKGEWRDYKMFTMLWKYEAQLNIDGFFKNFRRPAQPTKYTIELFKTLVKDNLEMASSLIFAALYNKRRDIRDILFHHVFNSDTVLTKKCLVLTHLPLVLNTTQNFIVANEEPWSDTPTVIINITGPVEPDNADPILLYLLLKFFHIRFSNFKLLIDRCRPLMQLFVEKYCDNIMQKCFSPMYGSATSFFKLIDRFLDVGMLPTQKHAADVYALSGNCALFHKLLRLPLRPSELEPSGPVLPLMMLKSKGMDFVLRKITNNEKVEVDELVLNGHTVLPCIVERVMAKHAQSEIITKAIKQLPTVPSLMELSRNRAREYFITAFDITSTDGFYDILDRFPMPDRFKNLLTFDERIYDISLYKRRKRSPLVQVG